MKLSIIVPTIDALDRAALYYRRALKEILGECSNDKPRITKIEAMAEQAIKAADYELDAVLK